MVNQEILIAKFKDFFTKNNLDIAQCKFLIAFSGGIDSSVISDLFFHHKTNFALAHCNFGLRGNDSDNDECFARENAQKYGVPFFTKNFKHEIDSNTSNESIQMLARRLRYKWFEEILELNKFDFIVTAHHINDSIETALLNFVKGTGIAGLRGIKPINKHIIRPLHLAHKQEIKGYAEARKLVWRDDLSNSNNKYQRNIIRNKVLPILKSINPSIEQSISSTFERLSTTEQILIEQLDLLKTKHTTHDANGFIIRLEQWIEKPYSKLYLFELTKPYGYTWLDAESICKNPKYEVAEFFSKDYILYRYKNHIQILPIATDNQSQEHIIHGKDTNLTIGCWLVQVTETVNCNDLLDNSKQNILYLDASKFSYPFTIRLWKVGDRFKPFGLKGTKKISDILNDYKLSRTEKKSALVLTHKGEIIWLLNKRTSELVRITSPTEKLIKIKLSENIQ